jgi:hypothetical protein
MVSYDIDAYGAHCGYTQSVVVRIRLSTILAICAQRERGILLRIYVQL